MSQARRDVLVSHFPRAEVSNDLLLHLISKFDELLVPYFAGCSLRKLRSFVPFRQSHIF